MFGDEREAGIGDTAEHPPLHDELPGARPDRRPGFPPRHPSVRGCAVPRIAPQATPPSGLEAVYLANRDRLVRFLRARGAGDGAEDLVQDLWVNVQGSAGAPIANPTAYLFRAADLLMIDRYRSRRQAEKRDQAWEDERHRAGAAAPTPEREVSARQETLRVVSVLEALGDRKSAIFCRVRVDGVPQRTVAEEFGVSLSTVESDLREVARARC
jgi:RNA polymerase sigma-70 factor (ECF subfamily)